MEYKKRVTAIMTCYNGERFVAEQVNSILNALGPNDELLVSDDGSKDSSKEILEGIQKKDSRLVILDGPHKGLNQNINFLLSKAQGEYIFISDQDDVWHKDKVDVVLKYFDENPKYDVIHHDSRLIDGEGKPLGDKTVYEIMRFTLKIRKFFVKSHIFGSMMAIRHDFLKYDFVPKKTCYDGGLALYAMRTKSLLYVPDVLMDYRRHENNASTFKRRKMSVIIKERWHLLWFIICRVWFKKKTKGR